MTYRVIRPFLGYEIGSRFHCEDGICYSPDAQAKLTWELVYKNPVYFKRVTDRETAIKKMLEEYFYKYRHKLEYMNIPELAKKIENAINELE